MKVLAYLALPLISALTGCADTPVATLMSQPPASFTTDEAARPALSRLALAADDQGLRVGMLDEQASRFVADQPPLFSLGPSVTRYVVQTKDTSGGTDVSIWCDRPNQPIFSDKKYPALLWDAYLKRRGQLAAEPAH